MVKKRPRQLYFKMIYTYAAIVLCIVTALVSYFLSDSRSRLLESNQKDMERICRQAVDYIEEVRRAADYIHKDLFRSPTELRDLLEYFRLSPEKYQEYSLGQYVTSNELVYKGIFYFMNKAFEAYPQLEKIEMISYETSKMTECYPEKIVHPDKNGKPRLREVQNNAYCIPGSLVYLKEIRNPDTMKPAGCILFTFEAQKKFAEIQTANPYAEMAVTFANDCVIYQDTLVADYTGLMQQKQYFTCSESIGEYQTHIFMDEKRARQMPAMRFLLVIGAGALASAVGILYIRRYVERLNKRVELILEAMDKVTTGDFKIRLNIWKKEDELDMIADNFNLMCEKLELYIEKSYLEEIERKNAQMQALQSQINPHFLYNTLEAIRMKAICNGDREVGKMLYSMVVLFRSQLKEADVITLGQELDYCKQYLELFEYRYQGTFRSYVDCPSHLLSLPVIKFVLQPVLENYFIHGIERDRKDNQVSIWAEQRRDTLYLYVKDNGAGMEEEKIAALNAQLQENKKTKDRGDSIGIYNVNRRIKAVCGEGYGISLEAADPKGLLVILSIRIEEEEGELHEKGNVS